MSVGGEAGTGFSTMRGRTYPTITQFTVFLENRVGALRGLLGCFQKTDVRIVGLDIVEATECAFVRLVLSHAERGREILELAKMPFVESDLVGVELAHDTQPLLRVCTSLLQAEVNVTQITSLLIRPHGSPAVGLKVDNVELAMDTLQLAGLKILREEDLLGDD